METHKTNLNMFFPLLIAFDYWLIVVAWNSFPLKLFIGLPIELIFALPSLY